MKKITLTPDWILYNLCAGINTEGNRIEIECTTDNFPWLELAANTLAVKYDVQECEVNAITFFFLIFNIRDIEKACPELLVRMEDKKLSH